MKNYEEMTQNVFQRRDAYVAKRKQDRRIIGVVLTTVFVCLISALALIRDRALPNDSTLHIAPSLELTSPMVLPEDTAPAGQALPLTILACTTDAEMVPLQENVVLPLIYYMDVADIRTLSSEEAIKELAKQQSSRMEERLLSLQSAKHTDILGLSHTRTLRRNNYLISTVRFGSFQFRCWDWSEVASVHIETATGYGEVTSYWELSDHLRGPSVTVDRFPSDGTDPLLIDWMYSSQLLDELEHDPTMPLSSFSDTITISITYRDGKQQRHQIDLIINEDGSIWASLQPVISA